MTGIAAIYCRISADSTRQGLGVERQEKDCRTLATREGLTVGEVFIDNDISASTKSKKKRPAFDAMVERVKAGEFSHVLSYSNSRLTRRMRELEDLIDLHEAFGVKYFTVVSGNDDLSTASGRQMARIKGSIATGEAELTGERVTAAAKQRAERGIPKKGRYRTFGYTDQHEVIEEEAAVIRDAFSRVIVGQSLQSLADLWRKNNVTMGNGKEVHFSTVKNVVSRPLYAGLAAYKGKIVGKSIAPAIVSEAVFYAAREALQERSTPRAGKNARTYLLAGLVTCGKPHCMMPMMGAPGVKNKQGKRNHHYQCKKVLGGCGGMSISGERLEAIALSIVRQRLIVSGKAGTPTDLIDYTSQIETVNKEIEMIRASVAAEEVEMVDVFELIKTASAKRRSLERLDAAQQADIEQENAFEDWEAFTRGSLSEQMAATKHVLRQMIIHPATSTQWDAERVTVHTKKGTVIPGSAVRVMVNPLMIVDGFRQENRPAPNESRDDGEGPGFE